jgi:hypothetical protein
MAMKHLLILDNFGDTMQVVTISPQANYTY